VDHLLAVVVVVVVVVAAEDVRSRHRVELEHAIADDARIKFAVHRRFRGFAN
jgi:hypothetical protein